LAILVSNMATNYLALVITEQCELVSLILSIWDTHCFRTFLL